MYVSYVPNVVRKLFQYFEYSSKGSIFLPHRKIGHRDPHRGRLRLQFFPDVIVNLCGKIKLKSKIESCLESWFLPDP